MQRARQLTKRALVRIGRTALLRPMGRVALRLHELSGRALKAAFAEDMQSPAQPLDLQGLVEIATIDDAVERSLLGGKERSPFLVPAIRTVWGYGFRHAADEHPWIAHLQGAGSTLEEFYACYQPADIEQAFRPLAISGQAQEAKVGSPRAASMSRTPWIYSERFDVAPQAFKGEETNGRFMGPEHGVQHLGPVSPAKVTATAEALSKVRESLAENGYRSDLGGWIRGFFLVHDKEFVFLVVGGQHRAAAWASLGNDTIPVTFQPGYPRLVDTNQLDGGHRSVALFYFNASYREARRQFLHRLNLVSDGSAAGPTSRSRT